MTASRKRHLYYCESHLVGMHILARFRCDCGSVLPQNVEIGVTRVRHAFDGRHLHKKDALKYPE